MSQANAVHWFEIYVQDMARARAFYETVFDITLAPLKLPAGDTDPLEMWTFPGEMHGTGASGALCRMPGVPSGPGGTLVYFGCDDCGETARRIVPAGGRVHRDRMSIGEHGFIVLGVDPDGNMIGLRSMG